MKSRALLNACLALSLLLVGQHGARAQAKEAEAENKPPVNSAMDGELMYRLLLGELYIQGGDPGAGFSIILDSARKTGDAQLYQRAVEVALRARSGDAALQAAKAWSEALPESREANRSLLQVLLLLNRAAETPDILRKDIALAPAAERLRSIASVFSLYSRVSDKKLAARVVEQGLAPYLTTANTGAVAWSVVGRMRLGAGDRAAAFEAAQKGNQADPAHAEPALLALEMMDPKFAQAEALVQKYLSDKPGTPVRLGYARALADAQREAEAEQQLKRISTDSPDIAETWLLLGALQAQGSDLAAAEASTQRYVDMVTRGTQGAAPGEERSRGLSQAYLTLAQIAEKRKDFAAAERWLARIPDSADMMGAQTRRASILAKQGKMEQAVALLRALPQRNAAEARAKLNAEVSLLRENRRYQAAYDLLAAAVGRDDKDGDLLYDLAMMAEKLGRPDEMERHLRQLMALRPDFHHAYNALGYSLADRNVRLPEARQLILKALEYAPEDPFITDSLAWVEFRMGNKAEALRLLEFAYKKRPDAEIAAHLGEVLWSMGDKPRAQSIWREGLLLNADNETLVETLKRLGAQP